MTPYTYIPSPDFINNLQFDYIETYSLQRGLAFEEYIKKIRAEYEALKKRELTLSEGRRYSVLHGLLGFRQYLINEEGGFHPSSKKTNTFKHDDPVVDRVVSILKTEIAESAYSSCAPIYRDAIIFYDSEGKIVATLNICFSCQYMETTKFNHIDADNTAYSSLKRLFIEIGHDIEEPENFIDEQMEKKVAVDKLSEKPVSFGAISLDTRNFHFNRDKAYER